MYRDYTNIPVDYINNETAQKVLQLIKEIKQDCFLPSNLYYVRRRLSLAISSMRINEKEIYSAIYENGMEFIDKLICFFYSDHSELFRDAEMWLVLDDLLKKMQKQNQTSILLAETTRGEELFSLLILLHELDLADKFKITIKGPSEWALNQILEGEISNFKMRSSLLNLKSVLKNTELTRYVIAKNNRFCLDSQYMKNVELSSIKEKKYDLIICRNKVLQLSLEDTEELYKKCYLSLADNGYMILGIAEKINISGLSVFKNEFNYENVFKKAN